MPSRRVKASSARPSQPQAEGRADDASSLTSNTVAQFAGIFGVQALRGKGYLVTKRTKAPIERPAIHARVLK